MTAAWHQGPLHAIEWMLPLALILGPLVALAVAIVVVRRRDAREDDETPGPRRSS